MRVERSQLSRRRSHWTEDRRRSRRGQADAAGDTSTQASPYARAGQRECVRMRYRADWQPLSRLMVAGSSRSAIRHSSGSTQSRTSRSNSSLHSSVARPSLAVCSASRSRQTRVPSRSQPKTASSPSSISGRPRVVSAQPADLPRSLVFARSSTEEATSAQRESSSSRLDQRSCSHSLSNAATLRSSMLEHSTPIKRCDSRYRPCPHGRQSRPGDRRLATRQQRPTTAYAISPLPSSRP